MISCIDQIYRKTIRTWIFLGAEFGAEGSGTAEFTEVTSVYLIVEVSCGRCSTKKAICEALCSARADGDARRDGAHNEALGVALPE